MSIREFNNLLKSLTVFEIFDILTRGYCDSHLTTLQQSIKSTWGYEQTNVEFYN